MDKLEKFWRDASANCEVCAETGVTKNMVLRAIVNGASDLETLRMEVPLCDGDRCTSKNSSGAGCSENATTILSIYAPTYAAMQKGHDHDYVSEGENEPSKDCGNCNLCQ